MIQVHLGDGRYVVVSEGAIPLPPVVEKIPRPNRPKKPPKPKGVTPHASYHALPGWNAWASRRRSEIIDTSRPEEIGKPLGHKDGFSAKELKVIRETIVNIVMNDDEINALLDGIKETDPVAAFALKEMIKLAAVPGATRDRFQVLKVLLDFTKSKPAMKSEVSVAQQDNWAMMLDEVRLPPPADESK